MKLEDIDITVEKTDRRKTVSIFIERDGSVRVLAPLTATDELIETAIKTKMLPWQHLTYFIPSTLVRKLPTLSS